MAAATIGMQLIRKARPESAWRQGQDWGWRWRSTRVSYGGPRATTAGGPSCVWQGALWITQEGDLRDHVIEAGEMFLISQPGKVVIMALRRRTPADHSFPGDHALPIQILRPNDLSVSRTRCTGETDAAQRAVTHGRVLTRALMGFGCVNQA